MSKQTAVEWLVDKLNELEFDLRLIPNHIEQAKAMEKEQIVDAVDGFPLDKRHLDGEKYYNETYGGQDEEI
jgi:hypothetical protein